MTLVVIDWSVGQFRWGALVSESFAQILAPFILRYSLSSWLSDWDMYRKNRAILMKQESYTVVEMIKDKKQSPTAPPEFMQTPVSKFRLYVRDFCFYCNFEFIFSQDCLPRDQYWEKERFNDNRLLYRFLQNTGPLTLILNSGLHF